jgi:hypothetical protein
VDLCGKYFPLYILCGKTPPAFIGPSRPENTKIKLSVTPKNAIQEDVIKDNVILKR